MCFAMYGMLFSQRNSRGSSFSKYFKREDLFTSSQFRNSFTTTSAALGLLLTLYDFCNVHNAVWVTGQIQTVHYTQDS